MREIDQILGEAIRLHRSGRLLEAERLCERIRKDAPDNVTALLLSGTMALQTGRYDSADSLFRHAEALAPNSADAATGRANALRAMGKPEEALSVLDAILQRRPDHAIAWNNRGNLLLETGSSRAAIKSYDRAIALKPDYWDAWHNRGVAQMADGDHCAAENSFTRALELQPGNVQALVNRGTARANQSLSRAPQALADLQKALALDGTNPDAWHRLGQVYFALEQYPEALSHWTQGLARQSDHLPTLHDRASLFNTLGRYAEAAADFARVLARHPKDGAAWQGRGIALARLNQNEAAISCFSHAIELKPDDRLSLYNRAAALAAMQLYREAASDLEALMALDPEFPLARGLLLNVRLHLCDWGDLDPQRGGIDSALQRELRVIHPFTYVLISDDPAMELRCARLQTGGASPPARVPLYRGEQYTHGKIRIAYLSSDFHQHATAYLLAGILEHHDQGRFEIFGMSYGSDDQSPMRARIQSACTRFFDARAHDDVAIAAQLRDFEIDIAIDLKGHTGGARPGILAHRPVPVQVNYLGYPGSIGADYIDYLIADRIVIPPDHQRFYAEQIVYLPDTYQPNDSKRAIAPEPVTRKDAGLPERTFVFCCFNGCQKILPATFDSWMRILSRVDNSVLWLLHDNDGADRHLRREAEARGVAGTRLIFAHQTGADRHLARLRLADLVLDTLPYGAHTTASDALWAGVPVLTRIGSSFAGRVAASLLSAADLSELITQSAVAYEALAEQLAASPRMIGDIREQLARNRETCALFDTARMTRHLETAYRKMWQIHQRGECPRGFDVS